MPKDEPVRDHDTAESTGSMSPAALERARSWVDRFARPLEQAELTVLLDDAPVGTIVEALTRYGTPDGAYGHALEPDCRTPAPSVLATLTALDIMRMHGVPGDDPAVARACAWLVGEAMTDPAGRIVWRFIPIEAQRSAHAPWWDQDTPHQLAETYNGFVANPGLALTAHLFRHAEAAPGAVPLGLLSQLAAQAREVATEGLAADEVNAHDAAAHLADEPAVPDAVRSAMTEYLAAVLPTRVMRAQRDFSEYGVHPLWVVPHPDHPLADHLAGPVRTALRHVIDSQDADGSWAPFWSWSGRDPQTWLMAEQEWRGRLVIRNLHALKAFGRLPEGHERRG